MTNDLSNCMFRNVVIKQRRYEGVPEAMKYLCVLAIYTTTLFIALKPI